MASTLNYSSCHDPKYGIVTFTASALDLGMLGLGRHGAMGGSTAHAQGRVMKLRVLKETVETDSPSVPFLGSCTGDAGAIVQRCCHHGRRAVAEARGAVRKVPGTIINCVRCR